MKLTVFACMLLLACSAVAQKKSSRATSGPNPDEPVIHNYILTMDKVNKYAEVMGKAQSASAQDPAIQSEMQKVSDTDVYDVDKVKLIENSPHLSQFLRQNGESAQDVVFLPMTLMTAGLAIAAQQQGGTPPDFVNPANVQFVKQHQAELEKLNLMGGGSDNNGASKDDQ
jgi:hypothetical protein